jgi:HEAT repeat protein
VTDRRFGLALTPAEQRRSVEIARLRDAGAAGVPPLLELLTDPSWAVRREVVAALGAAGDAAIGPLETLLATRRDDETRIAAAVDALVASTGDVLPALERLAAHSNPAVVSDAAQIAGRRRSGRAVGLLARLATHPDDNVAVSAIEGLGRVGGRAAIDALLAAVRTGSFFHVFPALDVLGRSGDPRAIPALAALLTEPMYALEAARALGKTGEASAVRPLASLMVHASEATVRVAAVAFRELHGRHLENYGSAAAVEGALKRAAPADAAVRHLGRALSSADPDERLALALALGVLGGDEARAVLARLLDAEPEVGRQVAAALARMGGAAEPQLREALRDGPSARRRLVLPVVSRATVQQELIACLADPDSEVRALAAEALARVGATASVPALFPLLADENPRVSQAATAAIQALGTGETRTYALEAARSSNPAVRRAALRILSYFGFDDGLPAFLEALRGDDARLRETAVSGLPFLDDPQAHEVLLETSRDLEAGTRRAAMRALGHSTSTDPRVGSALLAGLKDPEPWVRYYAAQALGRLGVNSAAGALGGLLRDPAGQVRVAAIEALSHLRAPGAKEALERAADDPEPDLRRAALIGLGMGGRRETLPVMLRAAAGDDPATRLVALSAIASVDAPEALAALERAAHDPDPSVRSAALGFLSAGTSVEATRALVRAASELEDRELALGLLAQPADGRVAGLLAALEEADDELAPLLASALARLRSLMATRALFQALAGPHVPARKAAAAALAATGSREAIDALRTAAERDPDPAVRAISVVLLGE